MIKRLLAAAIALVLTAAAGCSKPCDELLERVCEQFAEAEDSEELCRQWQTKVEKLNAEACESALESLSGSDE